MLEVLAQGHFAGELQGLRLCFQSLQPGQAMTGTGHRDERWQGEQRGDADRPYHLPGRRQRLFLPQLQQQMAQAPAQRGQCRSQQQAQQQPADQVSPSRQWPASAGRPQRRRRQHPGQFCAEDEQRRRQQATRLLAQVYRGNGRGDQQAPQRQHHPVRARQRQRRFMCGQQADR